MLNRSARMLRAIRDAAKDTPRLAGNAEWADIIESIDIVISAEAGDEAALIERVAIAINWFGYTISGHALIALGEVDKEDVDLDLNVPWERQAAQWAVVPQHHRDMLLEFATIAVYGEGDDDVQA